MDNSSQNDPGVGQQPETENSSGYQQYLDPGKPKKQRKMIIFAVIGAVMLLILLIVIVLTQSANKQNVGQNLTARETIVCSDKDCVESNFQQCTPSEYKVESEDVSSIKYTITGPVDIGCSTEVEYLANKYLPELAGKKMVCEFDNTIDFSDAVRNIFLYTDDYNCQGELADALNNLDSTN